MRADLLKFGDVILSSGYEFKDYGVVMATRRGSPARRYSHAALVINPAVWLESTGEGRAMCWMSYRARPLTQLNCAVGVRPIQGRCALSTGPTLTAPSQYNERIRCSVDSYLEELKAEAARVRGASPGKFSNRDLQQLQR
jgi:hypothetical protein